MPNDFNKNDDTGLWRKETESVEPLDNNNKTKTRKTQKKISIDSTSVTSDIPIHFSNVNIGDCPSILSYTKPGIQKTLFKKLRQGKIPVEASIDLHGMTVEQANNALSGFLTECQNEGHRCICIIHGKGFSSPGNKPIIKPMVNQWLRTVESVLAFSSALPKDGGNGAVYVLLKNHL